ncbi:hypothetical protein J1605_023124 [Eschrichtius robustus]|uniref:KRAB domain-containing protein n=1 Tax=Eschrichtius robustus TaxID=9764 RepID=A0AB34H6M2_ESCRO|nr:hypothetical protein J1605_023124 [Eschrichtius robustus]
MVPEKGNEGRAPDLQVSWRALPAAIHCLKKVLCEGARVSRIWVIIPYSKTIDYCGSAKPQFNFQKKDRLVSFKDLTADFTQEEWQQLDRAQRLL